MDRRQIGYQLAVGLLVFASIGLAGCANNIESGSKPNGIEDLPMSEKGQDEKDRSVVLPDPCEPVEVPEGANWNERYPQYSEIAWGTAARYAERGRKYRAVHEVPPRAVCVHEVEDVSVVVLNVDDDEDKRSLRLAVDMETGRMFTEEYPFEEWSAKDSAGEDAGWGTAVSFDELAWKTLPEEALVDLRSVLEELEVTTWPFTDCPPESAAADPSSGRGEHRGYGYSVSLLFKDGTGNDRSCGSDVRSVRVRKEMENFIHKYSPEAYGNLADPNRA